MKKTKSPIADMCLEHALDVMSKDLGMFMDKMQSRYGEDFCRFIDHAMFQLVQDQIEAHGMVEAVNTFNCAIQTQSMIQDEYAAQVWNETVTRERQTLKRKTKRQSRKTK